MQERAAKQSPVSTETLEDQFERIFGKPPHHRMKAETIRRKVEEHDTGDGRA